jgi:hypothetical protein
VRIFFIGRRGIVIYIYSTIFFSGFRGFLNNIAAIPVAG